MIKGSKKVELNIDSILDRITPFDIFSYYMPNKWKVNDAALSPFRKENNPSFVIGNRSGNLSFIDFTDTSYRGDCFTFVKMLFNLSNMDQTLKMIDKDFGLGISSGELTLDYKKITANYIQPETEGKRYALVQATTRAFTKEELAYWNEFHQDISDLKREHVYSIDKVYLNKKLFTLNDTELRFGYYYSGHWKIYRPFANKKLKWVPNNVPITTLEGKKNLVMDKPALITKSKKDLLVIKKIYPHVCAVQNEGAACFSEENVDFLKKNSKTQILNFDSDIAGVTNSQQITKLYDFDYINVPKKHLKENINDFADLGKIKGLDYVKKLFEEKGLY